MYMTTCQVVVCDKHNTYQPPHNSIIHDSWYVLFLVPRGRLGLWIAYIEHQQVMYALHTLRTRLNKAGINQTCQFTPSPTCSHRLLSVLVCLCLLVTVQSVTKKKKAA